MKHNLQSLYVKQVNLCSSGDDDSMSFGGMFTQMYGPFQNTIYIQQYSIITTNTTIRENRYHIVSLCTYCTREIEKTT